MEQNEKALLLTLILILASSVTLLSIYSYLQYVEPPDDEVRLEFVPNGGNSSDGFFPGIPLDEESFPFTTPFDLGNATANLPFNLSDFADFLPLNISDLADSIYLDPYPVVFHNSSDIESPFPNNLSNIPLFNVSNAASTAYLSNFVGLAYEGGSWRLSNDADYQFYEGQNIDYGVTGYSAFSRDGIRIVPLINISGFIPTSVYTTNLRSSQRLIFYPEEGVFFSPDQMSDPYGFTTVHYAFEESVLRNAETMEDEEYLQLPSTITVRTRWLAREITKEYSSPYERAKALELYLKENYQYDQDYTPAPSGHEPVDWFLFEEKRGVCTNFASAFVVMARSIGLPSRLVTGFVIAPKIQEQSVYASQAHAWAEVGFKDLGWILFEPTSGGEQGHYVNEPIPPVETITTITYISRSTIGKGEEFFVIGYVSTVGGEPVDEMPVEIFLLKIEGDMGVVWGEVYGEGETEDGFFNITCQALVGMEAGAYYIVAHSLGRAQYLESWSDESVLTPTVTEITFMNTTSIRRGDYFQVVGSVYTEKGIPLDGVTVTIHVNKTKGKGGILCGEGETKTGIFDMICQMPEEIDVGGYQVIAHGHEKGWRLESWSDPEIDVVSATNLTLVIPERIELGKRVPIHGRLTEEDGRPLNRSQTIHIYVNGAPAAEARTDEQGYFSAFHDFNEAGNHTMEAIFLGDGYYEGSRASSSVEVAQLELEIYTESAFIRGENVQFLGKATFSGRSLVNEPLEIRLDENIVSSTVTDEEGEFNCDFHVGLGEKLGYREVLYDLVQFGHVEKQEVVVRARTHLIPDIPRYVQIGKDFTIGGRLTEDGGEPIAGMEISIQIDNMSTWKPATVEAGDFRVGFSFSELGNYTVKGIFQGAGFYLNSSFTAEIAATLVDLEIYTNETLVRGETAVFHGQAWLGDDCLGGASVSIFIDDRRISQTETDALGVFSVSYRVPSDEAPGNHRMRYELADFEYVKEQDILVKMRTDLEIEAPSIFNPGDVPNVTVRLVDDSDQNIPNATVHLLEYDGLTDSNGSAYFQLSIPEEYSEKEMRLEARFEGTDIHMPSSTAATMVISQETLWLWLLCILLLAGAVMSIVGFALKRRNRKGNPEDKEEATEEKAKEEGLPAGGTSQILMNMSFPDVEEPFPDVWGVDEDFRIACSLSDTEGKPVTVDGIKLYANNELIEEVFAVSGRTSISHKFGEKGTYNIKCEFPGNKLHMQATAEKELRIVDYREEIVALYHSFLEHLRGRDISIAEDATPREVQQLAVQTKINEKTVEKIVRCFEEAQYSIHPIDREHYKTAWHALYQINRAGEA